MAEWSQLPYDLIALIASKLVELEDVVSFSAVCRAWRLVYLNKDWMRTKQIPWLMLGEFFENDASKRKFFSPSTFKWYKISLPEAQGSQCWGTSHGWVVIFDTSFAMHLLNPITQACINLPPLSILWKRSYHELDWFTAIQKVVVRKVYGILVTFVIYEHHRALAFSRCGDREWTIVPFTLTVSLSDVACLNDQILAVTMAGTLMLLEINGSESPRALFVTAPPEGETHWSKVYLVESSDDLLLVFRYGLGLWQHQTVKFMLYKLDNLKMRWLPLYDLGDRFLFVDDFRCSSGSAYGYFKSNCIYYAKDNLDSLIGNWQQRLVQQHMTVYNVKNGTTEMFWINDNSPCYTCPMWITPSLW